MPPDRISNLPCHVLDDIFKYLPVRDVVRTSILAREWRYKWTTIPDLVFDLEFIESLHHEYTPEFIIYHMLLSHKGSLLKFSLSKVGVESNLPVDHWLKLLANHCIEDLTLHLPSMRTRYKIPHVLFGFNHLKKLSLRKVDIELPPTFQGFNGLVQIYLNKVHFSADKLQRFMAKCPKLEFLGIINCNSSILHFTVPQSHYETPLNVFDHLKHLCLECIGIDFPPTFQGFSGLVKLDIKNAGFSSGQLHSLISKCPMLEFLSIIQRNDFALHSLVIDAPKLRVLNLVGMFDSIFLNTTSLEEFSLEYGDCEHFQSDCDDCEDNECDYYVNVELPESCDSGSNLIKIFGHLPSLRKLEGCLFFLQFMAIGGVPNELPDKLNHLTHLSLQHINFGILDNVTCALCLIKSSPNLESIDISFETFNSCVWPSNMTPSKKYQQSRKAVACLKNAARKKLGIPLNHLKTVTVEGVSGFKPEMEFVRFLLLKMAGTGVSKFEVDFVRSYKDAAKQARDELMSFHQTLSKKVPLTLR